MPSTHIRRSYTGRTLGNSRTNETRFRLTKPLPPLSDAEVSSMTADPLFRENRARQVAHFRFDREHQRRKAAFDRGDSDGLNRVLRHG